MRLALHRVPSWGSDLGFGASDSLSGLLVLYTWSMFLLSFCCWVRSTVRKWGLRPPIANEKRTERTESQDISSCKLLLWRTKQQGTNKERTHPTAENMRGNLATQVLCLHRLPTRLLQNIEHGPMSCFLLVFHSDDNRKKLRSLSVHFDQPFVRRKQRIQWTVTTTPVSVQSRASSTQWSLLNLRRRCIFTRTHCYCSFRICRPAGSPQIEPLWC